ncbi:two-component system, NtrC family, nitrogen regulation sensor histidine kinase NtrY [Candidatus Gastranaerophilus sp. (ex Termes propinquus)]|nr:two-component system, NtrC family, nitrogen regulation sensor histidine kinase NtrY [Candidatus Gastranaerophilus sp. (ex Termes propinquus)]
MQKNSAQGDVEMLKNVSTRFFQKINDTVFEEAIIIAPVMIEVYDKSGKVATINRPPFPFDEKNYIWENHKGLKFKFVEIPDPSRKPKEPPITVPQLFVLLGALLMSGFLIFYLNRVFLKPLSEITDGLEKVKDGDLGVKFSTNSENRHIQETFETLNEMLRSMDEKEILRNNFLQSLVHDLRAPIVAQNRAIDILEDELSQHELFSGMKNNNEDYLKLINLILEAQESQAPDVSINKIDIKFKDLINSVIEVLKPLADGKNITLVVETVPWNLKIWADYLSINRILINLVSNAIENIGSDKTVKIGAFDRGECVEIVVLDNGTGIKQENLDKIFNKYKSFTLTSHKSVSGLGLFIVKNLVEKQGGRVFAESSNVGETYTKFTITLPLRNRDD